MQYSLPNKTIGIINKITLRTRLHFIKKTFRSCFRRDMVCVRFDWGDVLEFHLRHENISDKKHVH